MSTAESFQQVSKIAFPNINCNWNRLLDDEVGVETVFKTLDRWNEVGNYVRDNFKDGIESLKCAIESGTLSDEVAECGKQLLVALCEHNVGYYNNLKKIEETKDGIALGLYEGSELFREAVIEYASLAPTLCSVLLACAFFALDEDVLVDVCDNCICAPYSGIVPESMRSFICDMFRYNHDFEGMLAEGNVEQYWRMGSYLNEAIQGLDFFTETKDGATLAEWKYNIDTVNEARLLLDLVEQGENWVEMQDIPDTVEMLFRYPNGSNGDILRYIFEEFGEAGKKSDTLWQGRFAKSHLSLLENFSTVINMVTPDPRAYALFDNHHLPTKLYRALSKVRYRYRFDLDVESLMRTLRKHKTEQKANRERLYIEVVLAGRATPKWKSEFLLYTLVRDCYQDAVYQYQPMWLGRQSLDIFIPSLDIAIEYQGKQHYESVDFFGGEQALKANQERDRRKRKLCESNGIKLIEWPYTRDVTRLNLESAIHEVVLPLEVTNG